MLSWIINKAAFALLFHINTSAVGLTQKYFDTFSTYFIVTAATNPSIVPPMATPTMSFPSYAAMEAAFQSGAILQSVRAIIYDNENWTQTPVNERQNPALYYQKAAALVHARELKLIATPAVDLVTVLAPGFKGDRYAKFLSLGVPAAVAVFADVYEVQAQGKQGNVEDYRSFVSLAADQARIANPGVQVLAGLSTNPGGVAVTGQQLLDDVLATDGVVSGYWLNIPGSSACPSCGEPQPQVAADFLSLMNNAEVH